MQNTRYEAKPPIGLEPRYLWDGRRKVDICEAIIRYTQVGKKIPREWMDELADLLCDSAWIEKMSNII